MPLGEWVMRTACAQNLAWQRMGLSPIRVVVNLSSRQLTRTVTDSVGRILRETGLESRYLGLELTETVLVNHQKEGDRHCSTRSAPWVCTSRWTTSAPATRRSATSSTSRWTR